jgi:hypothetical protein
VSAPFFAGTLKSRAHRDEEGERRVGRLWVAEGRELGGMGRARG